MSLLWHLGNHCWSLAGVCCHALSPTQVIGRVPLPHPGDHSSSPVRLRCSSWRPAAAGRPGPKTCSTRTCSLHLLLTPVPQIWSLDMLARAAPQSWLHRPANMTCSAHLFHLSGLENCSPDWFPRGGPQTGFPEVVCRPAPQICSSVLLSQTWYPDLLFTPGLQFYPQDLVSRASSQTWSPLLVPRHGSRIWSPDLYS